MKVCKPLFFAIALGAFFAVGNVSLHAQEREGHGNHSGYMHALTDLRLERAYLNRWGANDKVDDQAERAIAEIDAAMRELNLAGITDHKELKDHRDIDFNKLAPGERYHLALEAGKRAWEDVQSESELAVERDLKHRVNERIDAANHVVEHILERVDPR